MNYRLAAASILAITFVQLAIAEPAFRLGPRITYSPTQGGMLLLDPDGRPIMTVFERQPYVGAGIQAEYGPLALFRFRVEAAQIRFYTHGGLDFTTFPLGGEISVEPPVKWRTIPYLYLGGQYTTDFIGKSSLVDSTTVIAPPSGHFHAGLGGRFALNPRIDIFAEIETFLWDSRVDYEPYGVIGRMVTTGVVVDHIHAGIRFALGK